jgi:hypothetical protein
MITADDLAAAVGTEAGNELASAQGKIKHCLNQLTEEQVWWRSQPSFNSIGNLIQLRSGDEQSARPRANFQDSLSWSDFKPVEGGPS